MEIGGYNLILLLLFDVVVCNNAMTKDLSRFSLVENILRVDKMKATLFLNEIILAVKHYAAAALDAFVHDAANRLALDWRSAMNT